MPLERAEERGAFGAGNLGGEGWSARQQVVLWATAPPCPPLQPGEEAQGPAHSLAWLSVASEEWTQYLWL